MATYRYLGYGITNEQGIAKLDHDANNDPIDHSYTGTGAGELDIIASLDNDIDISDSSIQSETYEVTDCYWIEKSSTITGMYSVSGGTLTLDNGVFTLTRGSGTSYFYLDLPKSSLPISDFLGKDLTVQTDVTLFNATQLRMSLFYYDGSSWSQAVIKDIYDVGLMENTISIPSNSTRIRVRFDIYGNTDDNVVLEQLRFILG